MYPDADEYSISIRNRFSLNILTSNNEQKSCP